MTRDEIRLEHFDIILTNPPFGSKIPIKGESILKQYDLGHSWKFSKKTEQWVKGKFKSKEAPQILFIERNLQFLKPGGRMAIVLPDGILGNDSLAYLRQWLLEKAKVLAVIDVPIETFMPYTSTKTSIVILQKFKSDEDIPDYPIFMCRCQSCGHNRRGQIIGDDDISRVSQEYRKWERNA